MAMRSTSTPSKIKRTTYWVCGDAITLAFVPLLADQHPETTSTEPPPSPPPYKTKAQLPPRMTERVIRRALGRDREHTARLLNRIGYEATVRRIERA